MPVPSSGQVKLSDLVAEFGGDAPHALSEYYRDAGRVPGNNTSIPTSGQFRFSNAYGAVNEIAVAATSGTNVDLSSLFGGNWTSTVPKRLTIGSGVTIGGTGSSAAIIIPSNMAGTLEIDNAGSILGFGGAANGGAGGNGISNSASGVTINNTGLLAGGGGGGGLGGSGGVGGNGTSTVTTTSTNIFSAGSYHWRWTSGVWSGVGSWTHAGGATSHSFGGHSFSRGTYRYEDAGGLAYWGITGNIVSTVSTTGGAGGAGGAGGVGQGYNQSATSGAGGASGAAGGTNAGTGGTGGTGGSGASYGSAGGSGSTGNTGANGNASNGSGGSGGSSGGAAGAAVTGTSVTMNNTGTLYGAVA